MCPNGSWYISKAYPKFNIHGTKYDIFNGEAEKNILAVPAEAREKFPFLSTLVSITDHHQYNPPALSQLDDTYAVKNNIIDEAGENKSMP